MAKKGLIVFGVVATLALTGLGAWQFYFKDTISLGSSDSGIAYVTKVSLLAGETMGTQNFYAGVVEAQNTVKVNIASGRKVSQVLVEVGEPVTEGQLLFEYDLSSIEDDLKQKQLDLDKLVNEAQSYAENIVSLEQEKAKAKENQQLSYTIEIETARMNLKQNEYNQIKKQAELDSLRNSMTDTQVFSSVNGVIQKIDTSKLSSEDGDSLTDSLDADDEFSDSGTSDNSFITILGTGNYRVKGMINEQNRSDLTPGQPMIIRSRADNSQTWTGSLTLIDEQNAKSSSNDMWGMSDSSDSQTSSSSYPFYVELDHSENLMLGQHVYIEKDVGQTSRADGLWLFESFIVDAGSDAPYVWAANAQEKLEKRYVTLGEYDEFNSEYLILDGISESDSLAEPEEGLTEGMPTADSSIRPIEEENYSDFEEMDEEGLDDMPMWPDELPGYDETDWAIEGGDAGWDEGEDFEDWEGEESDFDDAMMIEDDEFDMDFNYENDGNVFDEDDMMSAG